MESVSKSNKAQAIELLRWPMALLVVCIHADFVKAGLSIQGDLIEMSHSNVAYYIITYISQVLGRIAVPLFFIISGYLFFRNFSEGMSLDDKWQWYKRKVKSRVKSLLLPLISWNFLMCLFFAVKQYTPLHRYFPNADFDWSIGTVLSAPFDFGQGFPLDNPLWFVRNLFVISLLSPLLFRKRVLWMLLLVSTGVWLCDVKVSYAILPTLVFFSMGG